MVFKSSLFEVVCSVQVLQAPSVQLTIEHWKLMAFSFLLFSLFVGSVLIANLM